MADDHLTPRDFTEIYMKLSDELGEHRMQIYTHNFDNPTDYYASYTEKEWDALYDRSDHHYHLLREEGVIFTSLLDRIKLIEKPMLLLTGEYDPVTCEKHVEIFKKNAANGEIIHFKHSGHTPHYEEADRFKQVLMDYLLVKNRPLS